MSWDEGLADRYDEWAAHMTDDVPFYVDLAREADGPVVELAVGTGRVAKPVARAIGRTVIGIDSSPAMLAQATGPGLDLREADMRDFTLDEPAALIYCPFRALLHVPTWADRRRVFENVAAALKPGGRFAWNAFAFDHHIAARLDGARQTEPQPHTMRYSVGENRVDIGRHRPGQRGHQHPVVGDQERVAWPGNGARRMKASATDMDTKGQAAPAGTGAATNS